MCFKQDTVFKLFEKNFVKGYHEYQLKVMNEYAIAKLARDQDLENIIHLKDFVVGEDNFGLSFKRYPYDLKRLLKEGCLPDVLANVVSGAVLGLCQLHQLGYIHGNFKLSHVVSDKNGEDVKIISFN